MLTSTRIEDNPRYQAARATCERTGSPLTITPQPSVSVGEGWTWTVIALLCVVGLAVLGLSAQ